MTSRNKLKQLVISVILLTSVSSILSFNFKSYLANTDVNGTTGAVVQTTNHRNQHLVVSDTLLEKNNSIVVEQLQLASGVRIGDSALASDQELEAGFLAPPEDARPRVWWHWMSGNVSKAGIRADLTWMKRIGIGGFQNFDAGMSTPQIVDKRLAYMTPEWKDAFLFTTKLADSLGLEMGIAGSPGWSESGGPWVTPNQGMRKFVWSETRITGGKPFNGILPKPPTTTGEFQNLRIKRSTKAIPLPEYYTDASVVAFRLPENDISLSVLKPKITSSGGEFNLAMLTDGDLDQSITLPNAKTGSKIMDSV